MLSELRNALINAKVPSRHFSILEKGMPYVPEGTNKVLRIEGGGLLSQSFKSKAEVRAELFRLRSLGIPLSKMSLRSLRAFGVHLSDDELHRVGRRRFSKKRRKGIIKDKLPRQGLFRDSIDSIIHVWWCWISRISIFFI